MLKKVEIEVDDGLIQEAIRRYRLASAREAVHLALRALLDDGDSAECAPEDEEYDEFSDLSAWRPRRSSDTG